MWTDGRANCKTPRGHGEFCNWLGRKTKLWKWEMIKDFMFAVLIVSSIGAALAAALALCEIFVSNYGDCKLAVNGKREIKVKGGGNLLSALASEKIFIPSACGGRGSCGLCKVRVVEGGGQILPTEEPYLTEEEKRDDVRLACQVKIKNDMLISIPEELFSVREYSCRCAEITELTRDMRLFRMEIESPPAIDYVPGQYIQLLTPRYGDRSEEVYRAYSVASDPADRNAIELIIRLVPGGICTTYCFDFLKTGDPVRLNGPYGEFRLSGTDAEIIFVAGGSGIAPIRCMLFEMRNRKIARKARFYFGGNTVTDICLVEEMRSFERGLHDFSFVPVVANIRDGDKWEGETGLVTDVVRRNVKDASACEGYLCGSPGMIDASVKLLRELGMPEEKIYYDKFA